MADALENTVAPVDTRAPSELGYVFVATYGRSGSTLLQGLLNAIPGYIIRGENGDALYKLYGYHDIIATRRGEEIGKARRGAGRWPSTPRHPWYGIGGFEAEESYRLIRELALGTLLRPEPTTRVTGFKEIRWWHGDWKEYVAFLRRVFPGARFIVNTRDHDAVMRSKWWEKEGNAKEILDRRERQLRGMLDLLGDDGFHLHYDDYVDDPARLRGLYGWLGEPFDEASVRDVMSHKHSY